MLFNRDLILVCPYTNYNTDKGTTIRYIGMQTISEMKTITLTNTQLLKCCYSICGVSQVSLYTYEALFITSPKLHNYTGPLLALCFGLRGCIQVADMRTFQVFSLYYTHEVYLYILTEVTQLHLPLLAAIVFWSSGCMIQGYSRYEHTPPMSNVSL